MSEGGRKKLKIRLGLAAAALLMAAWIGPTIFFNFLLSHLLAGGSGLTLSYDQARAGFLFRSAQVTGLEVASPAGDRFSAALVRLEGLSVLNLLKLTRRTGEAPAEPLFLAGELAVKEARHHSGPSRLEAAEINVRGLALTQNPGRPVIPARFEKLDLRKLRLATETEPDLLEIDLIDARNLGAEILGGLTVRALALNSRFPDQEPLSFSLWGLTVGGLNLESLLRLPGDNSAGQMAWWVLSGCDTLDLAQAVLTHGAREALNIRTANFDQTTPAGGQAATFTRRLDFSADLTALASRPEDPFWRDLRDLTGDRFQAEMNLTFSFQPQTGQAELRDSHLSAPGLGRLTLGAKLGGVTPVKSHLSPSQLLYSAAEAGWSLESLELVFEDQGFMANFYRHLKRTVFRGRPGPAPGNIMDFYVTPLSQALAAEQGLANLPVLVSETEAFLDQPGRLALYSRPDKRLPLRSLANPDKYDIIEKLHLTVQVNERAPIAVAVASGVFHERLPTPPKPMENYFEEEDI